MKKFLLITGSLLIIALLAVIAVFCYLSFQLKSSQVSGTVEPATNEQGKVIDKGIPLRDLPLTEGQRSTLETVGVDVDTFEITPAMQACAEAKLGNERMAEIIGGSAPTMIETTQLTGCL